MAYATVAQLREYLPQVPEYGQQKIAVSGSPTGGTFTLVYDGTATGALAYNATATTVQTALRAIAAIGSSGVAVKGRPGGPWVATFQGTLATDAAPLTLGTNLLTGGAAPSVAIEPATDDLLQNALDRATGIIRDALRSLLADPAFDYAAFGAASTRIVSAYDATYLSLPPHQAGSVSLVEYQSGSNPATYTTLDAAQWDEEMGGQLYRSSGWWSGYGGGAGRYRVTAVWGYGATPPASIEELTLELAVNLYRSRDTGGFVEVAGEGNAAIRQVAGLTKLQQQVLIDMRNQLYQVSV